MKPAPVAVQPRAEQQRVGVLQDKTSKLVGAKKDPKGAPGEARRLGREGGDDVLLFKKVNHELFFTGIVRRCSSPTR